MKKVLFPFLAIFFAYSFTMQVSALAQEDQNVKEQAQLAAQAKETFLKKREKMREERMSPTGPTENFEPEDEQAPKAPLKQEDKKEATKSLNSENRGLIRDMNGSVPWEYDYATGILSFKGIEGGGNVLAVRICDMMPWDWQGDHYSSGPRKIVFEQPVQLPVNASGFFSQLYGLEEIQGLENLDTSKTVDMSYLFYQTGGYIRELDLSGFDTSKVTNMRGMFSSVGLKNTSSLKLGKHFDVSAVTDMSYMFAEMYYDIAWDSPEYRKPFDLSSFGETKNVRTMDYMFRWLNYQGTILFGENFQTETVTSMTGMFEGTYLEKLDLSHFQTENVTLMIDMFSNNVYLKELILGEGFKTTSSTYAEMMFGYNTALQRLTLGDDFHATIMSDRWSDVSVEFPSHTIEIKSNYITDNVVPGLTYRFTSIDGLIKYTSFKDMLYNGTQRTGMQTFVWEIEGYYGLTFQLEGGVGQFLGQYLKAGTYATEPDKEPTREHYDFIGWYTGKTGGRKWEFQTDAIPRANTVLYARWAKKQYMVEFVDFDNRVLAQQTVAYGESVAPPSSPSREGYTFVGWDQSLDAVTGDLVIRAEYEKNNYEVTFIDPDGQVIKKQTVSHGEAATPPLAPLREGEHFKEWDQSYTQITAPTTIRAIYEKNQYEVSFVDSDGKLIDKRTVLHGEAIAPPIAPEKEGHTFKEWDHPLTQITGNLTIKAVYEKNRYEVIFVDSEGQPFEKRTVLHGESITPPTAPAKVGHTFKEWDHSLTQITGNLTVKAVYVKNQYEVTFLDHENKVIATKIVAHGEAVTPPAAPIREGYIFKEWDRPLTSITGNIMIKAVYEKGKYEVTFLGFDGTVLEKQAVAHGDTATPPTPPVRVGYTFKEWDRSFTQVAGNITVKAVYEKNRYEVTFLDFDGRLIDKQTILHEESAVAPNAPTRKGYTFKDWGKEVGRITGTTTFQARYEAKEVKVNYLTNHSSLDNNLFNKTSVSYDALLKAPLSPTRVGYVFQGWYTARTGGQLWNFNNKISTEGEINLYARWVAVYTVSFRNSNGTLLKTQSVLHGGAAGAPTNTARKDYTFVGWDKAFHSVTGNLTVTARHNAVNVTFKPSVSTKTIGKKKSHTLTVNSLNVEKNRTEYTIDKKYSKLASVNKTTGKITTKDKAGTFKVNVKVFAKNGTTKTTTVTYKTIHHVTDVLTDKGKKMAAKATVKKGKTTTLKTKAISSKKTQKATSPKTIYTTSNKKIATVDKKGKVKGVKKGKATITITTTTADGAKITKKVKVTVQ